MRALHESRPGLTDHLTSVAVRAEATARLLGLSSEEIERVRLAGRLHDVGKMAIPESILNKPGPLDDGEWEVMKRNPLIGERIMAAAAALRPVATLIRSTHERVDGTGYPDGLRGDDIPLGARIVAACDAFDAMVSDRPYRAAMTRDAAVAELRRCSGSQFDAEVVEALAAELERAPDGVAPWLAGARA
jgi:HD-GYP domain-containing protein (c-di-GMP phosphodiesterase class II)